MEDTQGNRKYKILMVDCFHPISFLVFSDKQGYRTIWGIYYRGPGWLNGYFGKRKAITNEDY